MTRNVIRCAEMLTENLRITGLELFYQLYFNWFCLSKYGQVGTQSVPQPK